MREVEDYDAKLTLFELFEAAKQGETVVIMHGGQPVAHLCPAPIGSPSLEPRLDLSLVSVKRLKTQMKPGPGKKGSLCRTACVTSWIGGGTDAADACHSSGHFRGGSMDSR